MSSFREWYDIDEKEPEWDTLILFDVEDVGYRIGIYNGFEFYDAMYFPYDKYKEVRKWSPLYSYKMPDTEEMSTNSKDCKEDTGPTKEDTGPTKEEFLKVYKYFTGSQDNIFVGKYDALRKDKFNIGIYFMMSILADMAGELDEYNKMWDENEAESKKKAEEILDLVGM